MATPQLLLSSLARAYFLTETHFSGDPEYADAIQEIRDLHGVVGWLVIRLQDGGFTLGTEWISESLGELGRFRDALEEAGIEEIRLLDIPDPEVLAEFFRRLHPSSASEGDLPSARFRGLEDQIGFSFRQTRSGLPGMVGGIQELFRGSLPAPDDDTSQADSRPRSELLESRDAPPREVRVLSSDLAEEVNTFLGSYDLLKAESEKRLRDGAAELVESRNAAALSELVQLLVESGGIDPPDEDAIDLAREIVTPAAASFMVAKLGAVREESERDHLVMVLSRVGREGATALADGIGEARDRSDRRVYMDALVRLGPMAYEVALGMLEDPRWYVVRNAVTVIGELGGDNAVPALTGTLTNGDSRVRRESIQALAKVGGPEAESLILGMLSDGDPKVRGVACRTLGLLGAVRATKPLLGLLKDPDAEVQVESLQALGLIGDPDTVPSIEKKALGRFFFRPPREIRITAFRALASIGTPRALRVLEKGWKDRDEGVRIVVRAIKPGSKGR
jgi:HEAT repeat protein